MEFGTEFLEFKIYINSIVQVYNTYVFTYVTRSTSNSLQKWYYSEKNLYTSHQKVFIFSVRMHSAHIWCKNWLYIHSQFSY